MVCLVAFIVVWAAFWLVLLTNYHGWLDRYASSPAGLVGQADERLERRSIPMVVPLRCRDRPGNGRLHIRGRGDRHRQRAHRLIDVERKRATWLDGLDTCRPQIESSAGGVGVIVLAVSLVRAKSGGV